MKEFIEKTLHQKVEIIPYKEIKKFPLVLRTNYEFYQMEIMDQVCILAKPKEKSGLAALRRQQKQIERLTGMYCVSAILLYKISGDVMKDFIEKTLL